MSFTLDARLESDTHTVTGLDLNELLLMNDSRYLWCILVPRLAALRDFHDIPVDYKAQMHREIDQVSGVVQKLAKAYKMNVAALGNMVEQLHVHVIARHVGDAAWPAPVWGVGDAVPYAADEADLLVAKLQQELWP